MTDKEVIKALEEIAAKRKENFSYKVLILIKRQQAELELLREFVSIITEKMNDR